MEVKAGLEDRVRELGATNYLKNQRALTEEIMFVAEEYAALVAEISGLAKLLATLLKKNAKQDAQVSKTVLTLVRTLLPFECFTRELKKETRLAKVLMEAADKANSAAWQRDIVTTLQALEKVGIQCKQKSKQDAFYRRVHGRVGATY